MSHRSFARIFCFITFIALLNPVTAVATQSPTSDAQKSLLTLYWRDAQGATAIAKFNLAQLDALPQHQRTLELPTPLGIPSTHTWQGISLRELLKISGNAGKSIQIMALNGYYTSLPVSDVERFDPLLAYRRNGQNLTIRDKGPFILIYPFNEFSELNQQIYINRSVWQINEIHIE